MYPYRPKKQMNFRTDFAGTNAPQNYGTQIQNPHIFSYRSYRFSITDSPGN